MRTQKKAHQELLNFMNSTDAKDIAGSLTRIFLIAVLADEEPLTGNEKDDLYIVRRLIRLADMISQE